MYDKAVDACIPASKSVPDWFAMKKKTKNLDEAILFNDNIVFF